MSGTRRRIPLTDTILIVDDTRLIVEGLVLILKKYYRPLAAFGGEQCLDILSREIPDLIILDIMMEPMNGWETLERIKADPRTRDIPVLMFSAKKITPEEAEAHRIAIDDFISKPVNPKQLIAAIEKVLSRRRTASVEYGALHAAGIRPEKIAEYHSLKTTIDVDASLRGTLQKELDLAHRDAPNRDELMSSIAVIGNRITEQSGLANELSREMDDVPRPVPPVPPEPVMEQVPAAPTVPGDLPEGESAPNDAFPDIILQAPEIVSGITGPAYPAILDPETIPLMAASTETYVRTGEDVAVPSGESVPPGLPIDTTESAPPSKIIYESAGPSTSAGQELPVTATAGPPASVPVQPPHGDITDIPEPLPEGSRGEITGPVALAVTQDPEILPEATHEMPAGPVPPEEPAGMAEPEPVGKEESPSSRTGFFSTISGSLRDRIRKSGK